MSYEQLSLAKRLFIEIEREAGTSVNRITKALGRFQSTLSREINLNSGHKGLALRRAHLRTTPPHVTDC